MVGNSDAYAALAWFVMPFAALALKPFESRFQRSVVGELYSHRSPILKVRLGRACQSSCTNSTS